ncbi:MAG TPA: cation diffusion facilitator family transporter [Rhodocyclaceae bacterium]|nr:cation diffusion facilitator family transporter [Rhodocyclaceae bacterium]HRQ47677.1 cation diffusion facilitator family transporter [Rhodocyclaceae bacterium]
MTHTHQHDHDAHGHVHGRASRFLPIALALTLGYAAVEALAGWWSGSLALLSDAGHMLTDAFALALATLAARFATRPPTQTHSYGLRRIETLAGMVNALLMLAVVSVIVWHAVGRLIEPRPVHGQAVIIVALLGLLLNIVVAWLLSRGESDLNTRAALLHVIGDLLGSVAALISGLVVHLWGWYPIDPILSMLICGLILVATLRLLRAATHTLLDAVPERISLPLVGRAMAQTEGVTSVHDLHIWSLDSKETALSAHVVLTRAEAWPEILVRLQSLLREQFGIAHVTLQPEVIREQVMTFHRAGSPVAPNR